ncbi:MAG: HAD hydrolase-like protein [Holosporales bacterium]|jgi:HAD superfamily hydrolase (TIGR01450 family)|nr:HAD hydrolase-like protein [Holosporales bacterium]
MVYDNFSFIFENYDSCLVDVYGVLYDGRDFYRGVLELLKKIKNNGKKVIILSNITLSGEVCKEKYSKKGLLSEIHYDEFISSGEAFKNMLHDLLPSAESYAQIFNRNNVVLANCNLRESTSITSVDFVYCGSISGNGGFYTIDNLKTKSGIPIAIEELTSIPCDTIQGFDEIANVLSECLKHNKPLVVTNPDIFTLEFVGNTSRPILCQGAIGEFYEQMGGRVLYFGKPYPLIYEFAKKFLADDEKTIMVGDTLWTDILGGNIAKFDTALALTGVTGEFIKSIDNKLTISEKIVKLKGDIAKKMTHKSLVKYSQDPTYIIESFAA